MKSRTLTVLFLALAASTALAQTYDVVIRNGRVIDPETGLDAIRNVGIQGHTIAAISTADIHGNTTIDATGLVVTPGFIDLHEHGQAPDDYRKKAFDGVTSALEMEIGAHEIRDYLAQRSSGALINYGATANYDVARALAFNVQLAPDLIIAPSGPATDTAATPDQVRAIEARLQHELDGGALGIGMGIQYAPGASRDEVLHVFRVAAQNRVPVFTHIRSAGHLDPGSSIEAVSEVIADAAVTGASLHIVHINSSCLKDAPECLDMVAGARARGLDITTEAYPYTAGMTEINSALFNPGWQQKFGIGYGDLAIPVTGERLTKERFDQLHADPKAGEVIIYMNDDRTVDNDIRNPLVMIASPAIRARQAPTATSSRDTFASSRASP